MADDGSLVAVGGQTITNLAVNPQANQIFQQLFLQLPNAPQGPADITVTGTNGTSTLKAGITYIPSPPRSSLRAGSCNFL